MNSTMIVLRFIHVLAGVFWGGSIFFTAGFLLPAVMASGPAGGAIMRQLAAVQKFPVAAAAAAILTILSGAGMYWHDVAISAGAFAKSAAGMTFGIGAVAGVVVFGIALGMIAPNAEKISMLGGSIQAAGGPPSPAQAAEMGQLQARMLFGSRLGAVFMAIAVIAMAIARYL